MPPRHAGTGKLNLYFIAHRHRTQPFSVFIDQLSSLLVHVSTTPNEFILTGDFNIHVVDPLDFKNITFSSLRASFNLTQHITISMHTHGHTLGLIITAVNTLLSPSILHTFPSTSNHYPIFSSLNITPYPPPPSTTFTYRRINSICLLVLISDLSTSQLITNPPTTLPELLSSFNDTVVKNSENIAITE